MNTVYLLLGTNEGDRINWLQFAVEQLDLYCGNISAKSNIYETAAWGIEDQPDFLNMAVKLETDLSPTGLLKQTNDIEQKAGRQRTVKWGQRTLDIDLLFYNNEIINTPGLSIPHPEIQNRRFALVPLNELAPLYTHPKLDLSVSELLKMCPDSLSANLFSGSQF